MDSENDICSICYEPFNDSQSYTLECNHKYHTNCIVKWFRNDKSSCPLCNQTLQYDNLSYMKRIDTIQEIKKLGRRKNCPIEIKNILNKIKLNKLKQKKFASDFRNFMSEHKHIIKNFKQARRERFKFRYKERLLERKLLAFTTINPIYIKK